MNPIEVGSLITGTLLGGYCLNPVPDIIKDTVVDSNAAKMVILSGIAIRAFNANTISEIVSIIMVVIMILLVLDWMRDYKPKKEGYRSNSIQIGM